MLIKANGIEINYLVEGREGAPWLLFSNSLATNLTLWDEQAVSLSHEFRILRYDQRGHGQTQAPSGAYNLDLLVDDVVALLDVLGIGRAYVVGISLGGTTAIRLAQRYPDRVDCIVPCDCAAYSSQEMIQQWEQRIGMARARGMESLVTPTIERWFSPEFVDTNPAKVEKISRMIGTTPVDGYIGCARALQNFDVLDGISAVRAPALFVAGSRDTTLPAVRALHGAIPDGRYIEIADAGHLANYDHPQAFTAILRNFLHAI